MPLGSWAAVPMATGVETMLNENVVLAPTEAASVAVMVGFTVPALLGVPETTPVAAFRLSPAGNPPALSCHRYGSVPPVALNVVLYAVPTTPLGSCVALVIAKPAG